MLKKLLTLSLVAVMLSTTVYAAVPMGIALAAETETEPVYEEVTTTATLATEGDMDFVIITDTDGTQTAKDHNELGAGDIAADNNSWFLAKIKIGSGYSLPLTSTDFQIRVYGINGSGDFYCVPLKATDFEMAKESAGSALASNLIAPSTSGSSLGTKSFKNANYDWSITLDAESFTADHYVGEHIYVAFQVKEAADSACNYRMTSWDNKTSSRDKYKMTVKGNKANSVDVATASAIYITDDKKGTQTADVDAVTADKVLRGGDTKWIIYKFETGKTYEKISSAKLTVTASAMTGSGRLAAYTATKEQWDAAYSVGDNTMISTEQQTHFVSPRHCGVRIGAEGGYAAKTLERDITASCEEQIKSGEVYVFIYAGGYNELISSANAGNNGQGGTLESVTLTVTGLEGAYEAPEVTDFDDSVLVWNKGNYGFYTTATSGKALLIAATYTGETLTDAEVITIDASTTKTNGGYAGTTSLTPGDSLKVFLWNEGTLVPIKSEVIEF